ncbi:hypothetical protein SELMODRAFT_451611 [Selaginella moellendorffii]|uniref:Myb-like domain-containing protein n=1 Tax=Selaginella moellendorffii TaxID=88036 RepID=D8QTW3_SELML|nr:hypothetical protein SELMODRAFT_451611 [Selaginella moellendorffii]
MAGMLPSPLKFAPSEEASVAAFDPADLEDPSVSLGSFSRDLGAAGNHQQQHHQHHPAAMEEGLGGDEIDKTESVGSKKKRAEMWQDSEMDALVSAYKQVHMKLLLAGKNGKHVFKSANEKWTEVRNLLLPMGVDRQPKEIERKWSNLLTAYKQIVEWNKKIGHPSYWELDDVLKKEKTKAKELPATFRVQLFESMAEFLGDRNGRRARCLDPNGAPGNGNSTMAGNSTVAGNSSSSSLSRFEMALSTLRVLPFLSFFSLFFRFFFVRFHSVHSAYKICRSCRCSNLLGQAREPADTKLGWLFAVRVSVSF